MPASRMHRARWRRRSRGTRSTRPEGTARFTGATKARSRPTGGAGWTRPSPFVTAACSSLRSIWRARFPQAGAAWKSSGSPRTRRWWTTGTPSRSTRRPGVPSPCRQFSLLQFHFHLPSEHTVEGESSPMEVHFVHQAEEGDLAVIGVFMDAGEAHPAIQSIWDAGRRRGARTARRCRPERLPARRTRLLPVRRLPDYATLFRGGELGGDDRVGCRVAGAGRRLRRCIP